jgi:hypothetical protein
MSQTDSVFIGMKAAARAAAVASGALGKRVEIDPVFALIEQHASDELQFQAFLSESAEREKSNDEANTWSENVQACLHELIETLPTTLAGAIAVLAHIQKSSANESMNQSEWLELLASLEKGLRVIAEKQAHPALHAGPNI